MTSKQHIIYLRRVNGEYRVSVEPEVTGFDFSKASHSYAIARTFARGVALHRGFTLTDETGESQA